MLYRKIETDIANHLRTSDRILIVQGARQVGKSYIIRHVGKKLFKNFIEINLVEDKDGRQLFANVHTVEDFYLTLSAVADMPLGDNTDTLVFLDEIQEYPSLLTMLKFLRRDNRYSYIASGSLLGVTLRQTTSIPIGSIALMNMYPMDFEEFIIANGVGAEVIAHMRECYIEKKPVIKALQTRIMDLFKKYLIAGGMPAAVNEFVTTHNVATIRQMQTDIINMYKIDASKYDFAHRLNIRRIYEMIPSAMENKKKRIIAKDIEDKKGARFDSYQEDIEYIISSGIALEVRAISNPRFPLLESVSKNLLKLYLNDVGLLTCLLYKNNIKAILDNDESVNLGAVYESVVAQELKSHGHNLFYYDNKANGEVDFLVDDYDNLTVLPIEVKSGKDYTRHTALSRFVSTPDYGIKQAYVLNNTSEVTTKGSIIYMPVYYIMFV